MTPEVPADGVQPKVGRHRPDYMTRRIHACAALSLLLLAAACGARSTGAGDGGQATSTNLPSASVTPLTANRATPDPAAVDLHPVQWTKATAGADNKLVVQYTAGGRPECSKLGRVDVAETADAVTVSVLLGRQPGADCTGPQPMIAAVYETVVDLKSPLDSRKVNNG